MGKGKKQELENQVLQAMKEYVISVELFRHSIAKILNVNATDMECLSLLFHRNIATPSDIQKYTGISSGSTTAMLNRLEKKGLTERHPNPKDRRGVHIVIVKEKLNVVAPLFASLEKAEKVLVSNYSVQELESILGFMHKTVSIWEKERENIR